MATEKSNKFELHVLNVLRDPDYREDFLRRVRKAESVLCPEGEGEGEDVSGSQERLVRDVKVPEPRADTAKEATDPADWLHVCHDQDYREAFNTSETRVMDKDVSRRPFGDLYCYLTPSAWNPDSDVTALAIWQGFKEATTAHGLPRLNASTGVKRWFWLAIMVITAGLLLYNLAIISKYYFSFPTDVTIRIQHETELPFPAITLCNMNPVKKSALEASDLLGSASGRRRKRAAGCEPDWHEYNDKCYFVCDNLTLYDSARADCESRGARLMSVADGAEQAFLETITDTSTGMQYWLGMVLGPGGWYWLDGTNLSYTKWADLRPDGRGECLALVYPDEWKDKPCVNPFKYVCESYVELTTTEQTTMPTAPITSTSPTAPTTSTSPTAPTTSTSPTAPTTSTSPTAPTTPTTEDYTFSEPLYCTEETTTVGDTTAVGTTSTVGPADETTTESVVPTTSPTSTATETTKTTDTTPDVETSTQTGITTTGTWWTTPDTTQSQNNLLHRCCCTCCLSTDTCNTCASADITDAATCAAEDLTTPTPATPAPTTPTPTPEPQTVPGSQYPERIPTREDFQNTERLTERLANVDLEFREELGYRAADVILECQYSGYTCSPSDFVQFYNPVHGNCFIFNSGWNGTDVRKASKTGRRYGLHLILNIIQSEYVTEGGDTAGVRLVVHPRTRVPFPEDEGITVSPGHVTVIAMRQVELQRKQAHGDCVDPEADHSAVNAYEELYPVKYSAAACLKTCYQKHVIENCGCGDAYYPLEGAALTVGSGAVHACDSDNITQDDCVYGVKKDFTANLLECTCKDPCSDTAYSLEVSMGTWPSSVHKDTTLTRLADKIGSTFDIADPSAYKQNLLKVELAFEEFNFEKISEKPGYTETSYISDIGGCLGLWVGFSIMTIAEFLEIAMDYAVYLGSLVARAARSCKARP